MIKNRLIIPSSLLIILFLGGFFVIPPPITHAQTSSSTSLPHTTSPEPAYEPPLTQDLSRIGTTSGLPTADFRDIILGLVRLILRIIGIILFLEFLYAGFLWMLALGDDEKADQAKKILMQSVIGLVLIITSYNVVIFILDSLNGLLLGGGERLRI